MNILITGGAGYIGSVLSEKLLSLEHSVTVIDTQMYNKTSLLPCVKYGEKFNFVRGDVRNEPILKKLVSKHDILIPLAAMVGAPLCDRNPTDAELINFKHIKNMCDWKSAEQWILYPNSNSGYGVTDGTFECTEESPMNPISIYGKTKLRAELSCQEVENHLTLRLATVFGVSPRPRFDLLVNNLVMRAVKEKIIVLYENQSMRNYIHVQDIVGAFVHSIHNWPSCKNNTYNVGNDSANCNKLQLVQKIKNHVPVEIIKAEYTKDPDGRNYIVSSKKLYNTGYRCVYDLDYGIKELVKVVDLIDEPVNANY
jgi:nucleoside-diphosphate-sugar epimerase|tara:strand:- start:7231 stop:8163 length:933 start_codon:yes stop_codon:yes gene_type:complete